MPSLHFWRSLLIAINRWSRAAMPIWPKTVLWTLDTTTRSWCWNLALCLFWLCDMWGWISNLMKLGGLLIIECFRALFSDSRLLWYGWWSGLYWWCMEISAGCFYAYWGSVKGGASKEPWELYVFHIVDILSIWHYAGDPYKLGLYRYAKFYGVALETLLYIEIDSNI